MIALTGPSLPLAPTADPSDDLLDLVAVREADRNALAATSTAAWRASRRPLRRLRIGACDAWNSRRRPRRCSDSTTRAGSRPATSSSRAPAQPWSCCFHEPPTDGSPRCGRPSPAAASPRLGVRRARRWPRLGGRARDHPRERGRADRAAAASRRSRRARATRGDRRARRASRARRRSRADGGNRLRDQRAATAPPRLAALGGHDVEHPLPLPRPRGRAPRPGRRGRGRTNPCAGSCHCASCCARRSARAARSTGIFRPRCTSLASAAWPDRRVLPSGPAAGGDQVFAKTGSWPNSKRR